MPPKKTETTSVDKRSRLQALLKAATAEKLKECLLGAIPDASVAQIDALLALVGPLASAATKKIHCARCHKLFSDHANHPRACQIPHDGRADGERTETGDDAVTMREACCGLEYD